MLRRVAASSMIESVARISSALDPYVPGPVAALAGLDAFDWSLFAAGSLAVLLIISSARRQPQQERLIRILAPVLAGLALILFLALRYRPELRDALSRIPDRPAGIVAAAAILFVAAAVTRLIVSRVVPAAARAASRVSQRPWAPGLALVLILAPAVAVAAGTVEKLRPAADPAITLAGNVSLRAAYRLRGHPTDLVFRGRRDGYVAFAEGEIARFELPDSPGGRLELEPVALILDQPRGLAIIGRYLFVSELGKLPCPRRSLSCKWSDITDSTPQAAEIRILKAANGRIVRFTIGRDGALTHKRAILAHLPFVSTEHGVNAMTAGPDGLLYFSVGNVDVLYDRPAEVKRIGLTRPNLLGTVAAVSIDGRDLSVVARGLRNVYDLTFDDEGNLYGVDNDGPAVNGWREEEVLRIRRGANYGYPREGSFRPYRVRTDPPIGTLQSLGSAGIEWAGNLGLGAGLVIGSGGKIELFRLSRSGNLSRPDDPGASYALAGVPGYVTSIEPGPDDTAIAAMYSTGTGSLLLQFRVGSP